MHLHSVPQEQCHVLVKRVRDGQLRVCAAAAPVSASGVASTSACVSPATPRQLLPRREWEDLLLADFTLLRAKLRAAVVDDNPTGERVLGREQHLRPSLEKAASPDRSLSTHAVSCWRHTLSEQVPPHTLGGLESAIHREGGKGSEEACEAASRRVQRVV
eukprot:85126-Pleurochrysis_carterae.AAC.1